MDINFWRDSKQPLTPHPPTPPFGVSPNIHPFLWVQGSLNTITSNANVSECNAFAIEQQATINQIPIITRKHIICKCCMKSKKSILSNLINIPFAQRSNETSISNGIDSLQRCYVTWCIDHESDFPDYLIWGLQWWWWGCGWWWWCSAVRCILAFDW